MLPVVRGEHRTATSIVRYTVLLIGITMLPFAFESSAICISASRSRSGQDFWACSRSTVTPRRAGEERLQPAHVPRGPVHRDGDRPDRARMTDADLAARNNRLGLALLVFAVVVAAATIGVSYLYLALD